MRKINMIIIFLVVAALASCGGPSTEYNLSETILTEDFSSDDAWEFYVDEDAGYSLQVNNGVYQIQTDDSGYIWGLNEQNHNDVVMEVTTSQLSSHDNNAYGIMCRSDTSNNGDGYYFLISGDGYYSISRGEGDDVNAIVDWTQSSAINKGAKTNTLRVVCIGDYLALYINDKFVTEANDSTYTSGYAGLAATAFEGGDISVTFDDLTISQGSLVAE